MTMNPIYPLHCVPCLAKRECVSLPLSINCGLLRRVPLDDMGLIPKETATLEQVKAEAKSLPA